MNSKLIKLLSILIVLALAVLVLEWRLAAFAEKRMYKALQNKDGRPFEEQFLPQLDERDQALESFADLVNRPLFIEGRKPVADAMGEEVVEVDLGQLEDWQLMGIVSTAETVKALFAQSKGEKKYQPRVKGDDIAGWRVREIKPDKVILEKDGQLNSIKLRKPKPKVAKRPPVKRKRPKTPGDQNRRKPARNTPPPNNPFTEALKRKSREQRE